MTARKPEREGLAEGGYGSGSQIGLCEQDGQHGQRDSMRGTLECVRRLRVIIIQLGCANMAEGGRTLSHKNIGHALQTKDFWYVEVTVPYLLCLFVTGHPGGMWWRSEGKQGGW